MRREQGQSLTEYCVIGALVGVLAIPAVLLVGDSLNGLFGDTSSRLSGDPQTLISNMGQPTLQPVPPSGNGQGGGTATSPSGSNPSTGTGSGSGSSTGSGTGNSGSVGNGKGSGKNRPGTPAIMKGNGWQAQYDAASGQIIYAMPESGGGGTNTASVSGLASAAEMAKVMASTLYALADSKDSKGNALPADLRNLIKKLANQGHVIAQEESELASAYGKGSFRDLSTGEEINAVDLNNANMAFTTAYDQLMAYIGGKRKYEDLGRKIDAYTGMINTTAIMNLKSTAPELSVYADPIGVPPAKVPALEDTSKVADQNATDIGKTAKRSGSSKSGSSKSGKG